MTDVSAWSQTDASNNSAAPAGFPEGMAPSGVNDAARAVMGSVKRFYDHINPTVTSAGSVNAQTLTYSVAPTALTAGDSFCFIVGSALANTGATTLNVNALGATNIKQNGNALIGGELQPGCIVEVSYDGTNFHIIGGTTSGVPGPCPNMLINPGMEIDQANEGATLTLTSSNFAYIVDGWQGQYISATAVVTGQRVADAPVGLTNSIKLTVSTGAAVAATDVLNFKCPIEANNITNIAWGTANAKPVALRFWVKSSIGSYTACGAVKNGPSANRSYAFNFTITSAATWEEKIVIIPGDVTGSWTLSGNTEGLRLVITAATGANFQGTVNTWTASSLLGTSAITNTLLSTNGATFQITGVKLEVSPVATPYVRRMYAEELALCQRYYEKSYDNGTAVATITNVGGIFNPLWGTTNATYHIPVRFMVPKRVDPTMTVYSTKTGASAKINLNDTSDTTATAANVGMKGFDLQGTFTPTVGGFIGIHYAADART